MGRLGNHNLWWHADLYSDRGGKSWRSTNNSCVNASIFFLGIDTQSACISFQVVQECLNTALRKAEIPLIEDEMGRYVTDVLAPLYRVQPDIHLYQKTLYIRSRYRYSFYDASLRLRSRLAAKPSTARI